VLVALTGYEIGLLVVACAFIVFALVVALVVPRARPDFPARRLGVFIAICIGLFFVQMGAVLALAELGEEGHAEEAPVVTLPVEPTEPGTTDTTETGTTETETTETETTETTETGTTEPADGQGDPVAGKEVFLGTSGCASCHALADAGSTGAVGPNLDDASPSFDKVVERVTEGQGAMPSFADTLSEQQIQDVAAYVSSVVD
jgi:mono/diheme cytochrome c family protein